MRAPCNIYPRRPRSHRAALLLLYIKRFICGVFGKGERVQRAFYLIFDKVYCGWKSIVSAELSLSHNALPLQALFRRRDEPNKQRMR